MKRQNGKTVFYKITSWRGGIPLPSRLEYPVSEFGTEQAAFDVAFESILDTIKNNNLDIYWDGYQWTADWVRGSEYVPYSINREPDNYLFSDALVGVSNSLTEIVSQLEKLNPQDNEFTGPSPEEINLYFGLRSIVTQLSTLFNLGKSIDTQYDTNQLKYPDDMRNKNEP
jgi:hypothetical protein